MKPVQVELEEIISKVQSMDEDGADRLDLFRYVKELTAIVQLLVSGWTLDYDAVNMEKFSKEELLDLFTFHKAMTLEVLKKRMEFKAKLVGKAAKKIEKMVV